MGLPTGMNANYHPELSDVEFVQVSIKTYFGWDDTEYLTWLNAQGGVNARNAYTWIQQGGRAAWYAALQSNIGGNDTDGWFYNLPPWTWMVAVPVIVIAAAVLIWGAWGKDLYNKSVGGNGSGRL